MYLTMEDSGLWQFAHGAWRDGENGIIRPVGAARQDAEEGLQGYRFAFYRKEAYRNFTASFEFMQESHTDVGLIFGAKDAANFYALHFPCCGQACRAQHFWAVLSVMDDSGYLRVLRRELVNRVNSMTNIWHSVRITASGSSLRAVIDGKGVVDLTGLDSGPGYAGVLKFNTAEVRSFEIAGEAAAEAAWNPDKTQATNWFYPCPAELAGKWQKPVNLLRTSSGGLLLYFSTTEVGSSEATFYLARSSDNGRSWSEPEPWWNKEDMWQGQRRVVHTFPDGALKCAIFTDGSFEMLLMESRDEGRTWSEPVPSVMPSVPAHTDMVYIGPAAFVNLADGAVLLTGYGTQSTKMPDSEFYTWGSRHCQGFATRSEDGGFTWSELTNIDGITDPANGKPLNGNMDLTEVCAVQTGDGDVIAFARPLYSPWMWEARSPDGGKTWDTCVRGSFPGYATPNMLRTRSGYIAIAHRLPGLTVDVSLDDGKTWTHAAMIDSAIWAMGSMLEIEPDVILYVYWDSFQANMRAQAIKITEKGVFPFHF